MKTILFFCILALAAPFYFYLAHLISKLFLVKKSSSSDVGAVFVTDMTSLDEKILSTLSSIGAHVLVGVDSFKKKASFIYRTKQGIEPIGYDKYEPGDLLKVIYRLEEIKRQLNKHLDAVIINLVIFGHLFFNFKLTINFRRNMIKHMQQILIL